MRLKDRQALADQCAAIAARHGAEVEILPRGILGTEHETLVRLEFADIGVSFDIGGCLAPGVLVHFYGAKRDLKHHAVFDSINECHRRKATTWNDDSGPVFLRWLDATCAVIAKGEVFA